MGVGDSGPDANEDELDLDESCKRAISSRRRSASGIQLTLAPPPPSTAESGPVVTMLAPRAGFGIEREMSRPSGFLREIDDFAPPNGDFIGELEPDPGMLSAGTDPVPLSLSVRRD
jgi:hypothetical protein